VTSTASHKFCDKKWQFEIRDECAVFDLFPRDAKIPKSKSQMTNKYQHAAQAPALRVTKNPNNKPAQNPQSVFVLNFENWDLVRLVYPFENGIYCQNR